MARLSDLVNVNITRNSIKIQGVSIPVIFTFESFPYVEEAFGTPYHEFEKEMNDMLRKGQFSLGENEANPNAVFFTTLIIFLLDAHFVKFAVVFEIVKSEIFVCL